MIRQGGYHAFSFRKIAEHIGIKSSSVHYHFASKENLGVVVVRQYTDKFLDSLGQPEDLVKANQDPITVFVNVFRNAVMQNNQGMCLCGIFASAACVLPERVNNATKESFNRIIKWLEHAYLAKGETSHYQQKAQHTMATLQGAVMISNVMRETDLIDNIIDSIT